VVALIHAFVGVATVVPLLVSGEGMEIGGSNTPAQKAIMSITFGFFSYDLISWMWSGLAMGQ